MLFVSVALLVTGMSVLNILPWVGLSPRRCPSCPLSGSFLLRIACYDLSSCPSIAFSMCPSAIYGGVIATLAILKRCAVITCFFCKLAISATAAYFVCQGHCNILMVMFETVIPSDALVASMLATTTTLQRKGNPPSWGSPAPLTLCGIGLTALSPFSDV